MTLKEESISIVIVGNWNKYILNPKWLSENIFDNKEIEVKLSINFDKPPIMSIENIRFIPAQNKVYFFALDKTPETLKYLSKKAYKLIETLEHTPISTFGTNVEYVTDYNGNIDNLINTNDEEIFKKMDSFKEIETSILKTFEYNDKIINLNIKNNRKIVEFSFNFVYPLLNNDYKNCLTEKILINNKEDAEMILRTVYGLEVE